MVEPSNLREALAAFLGDDRFHKFVEQGFRRGRLRYWQEQQWQRFTATHPEFAVGLEELAVAIRTDANGEDGQRRRWFVTTAAALAGGIVGGTFHIAMVYGCWLLYLRFDPPTGGRLQYLPELMYVSYALFVAPLSALYGAGIGYRWAQSGKSRGKKESG